MLPARRKLCIFETSKIQPCRRRALFLGQSLIPSSMAESMAEFPKFRAGVTAYPPSRQQAMPQLSSHLSGWASAHARGRNRHQRLVPLEITGHQVLSDESRLTVKED
jgi:hypothetical protein